MALISHRSLLIWHVEWSVLVIDILDETTCVFVLFDDILHWIACSRYVCPVVYISYMEQYFYDVSGMSIDYMHEMNMSMVLPSCLISYKNEPVYVVSLCLFISIMKDRVMLCRSCLLISYMEQPFMMCMPFLYNILHEIASL
jgi:hypothetical protein